MFRALITHPQKVQKRHLVYYVHVHVMSVGYYYGWSGTGVGDTSSIPTLVAANLHNTHVIHQVSLCSAS
jgi:hypothetical protein